MLLHELMTPNHLYRHLFLVIVCHHPVLIIPVWAVVVIALSGIFLIGIIVLVIIKIVLVVMVSVFNLSPIENELGAK